MCPNGLRPPRVVLALTLAFALAVSAPLAGQEDARVSYARELLQKAGVAGACDLRVDAALTHPEAFSILHQPGKPETIVGGGPAGVLYGVQEFLAQKDASPPVGPTALEKPDFPLRGTALFLMKDGSYDYELTPAEFPWFYDRELLTHFLDYLFASRFNAIFLWSGNVFPSLVELPEYPDARTLSREQLLANQEQFRWFTDQCAKRNISVLVHFYNIHLTKALAQSRGIPLHYSAPDPFAAKFMRYTLGRFLTEFASVGLYVCPGEVLESKYHAQWIRDVILKAAVDSGRHPLVVVRDWNLLSGPFKEKCHYDNLFTELKHNVEMIVSPVPDTRHAFWVALDTPGGEAAAPRAGRIASPGVSRVDGRYKHIVNLHEAADVKPFRWASPLFIHEMAAEWQKARVDGAEVYGRSSWRWPYTLDKLAPDGKGVRNMLPERPEGRGRPRREPEQAQNVPDPFSTPGPKLLTFERDALWLEAFGRYLWKVDRDLQTEAGYWRRRLAARFGSSEAGRLLYEWYNLTGPILPGLQNLTSVANGNLFPTVIAKEQTVDAILAARTTIEHDIQVNAARPTDPYAKSQHYPSRPVDTFFFERYRAQYKAANLTSRYTMPVAEYAERLAKGQQVADAMTPDKVTDLMVKLAGESQELARQAETAATTNKVDAAGYVTDSQAIRLIAEYYQAKIKAAIEKQLWQLTRDDRHRDALLKHMEGSVSTYRKLVELTNRTYIMPTDLGTGYSWRDGLKTAEQDLAQQRQYAPRQEK
jgi:hypothetical protein